MIVICMKYDWLMSRCQPDRFVRQNAVQFTPNREIIIMAANTVTKAHPSPKETTRSSARLEARISHDLHASIKRAAEIQGCTMTDFVIQAVQAAATQTIADADLVRLSVADQETFARALISPVQPNAALKKAFARANQLLAD